MATDTVAKEHVQSSDAPFIKRVMHWQSLLPVLVALLLFALALWLRMRELALPFDRDSYDEGVYWQTLRAMSAGHPLYQETFYSQPPFFLLSVFPTYMLLGETLWAARFAVVVISLCGLLGAFLLGKALSGRIGAVAALLLLAVDPLYLAESQTLQAEAPSVALSLLGVGMAYLWWERPDGLTGICYAVICGIAVSLGILCKLLVVPTLVPICLLMLAHLWRTWHKQPGMWKMQLAESRSLLLGLAAFILTTVLVFLPFMGSFRQLWDGVVTFHNVAHDQFKDTRVNNLALLQPWLLSIPGAAALYGTIAALLRRDWRVLSLLAWLLATLYLLWRQTPLFPHHFVALTPPLIALAIMGIGPMRLKQKPIFTHLATVLAIIVLLLTASINLLETQQYFRDARAKGISASGANLRIARELQSVTQPAQFVITDAQFIAALAERATPPSLVDTSAVRIQSGYVTVEQLIHEAEQTQVQAVLFYTGRLKNLSAFHAWVSQHFRLVQSYGDGKELWVKL
jgi:4-amino-4-deoxy-L-arabinose transferase-like glycosyltransferase